MKMTAFMTLMMEAVRTSETSLYFHDFTRCHIPESCHIQIVFALKDCDTAVILHHNLFWQ
jgi:hypothetical protein